MNTTSVREILYVLSTFVISMLLVLLDIFDYHYHLPINHALGTKVDLLPDTDHEYHLREEDITQIFLASFFFGSIAFYFYRCHNHNSCRKG
jgi:hypothetical protein